MLLAYREDASFFGVGRALGAHHQTVQRYVERALARGPMAALDDRPRPGREATITAEAKAWVVDLACRKAKELGYPHELWTTRLLARHAREHGCREPSWRENLVSIKINDLSEAVMLWNIHLI
jgi:transposase